MESAASHHLHTSEMTMEGRTAYPWHITSLYHGNISHSILKQDRRFILVGIFMAMESSSKVGNTKAKRVP